MDNTIKCNVRESDTGLVFKEAEGLTDYSDRFNIRWSFSL